MRGGECRLDGEWQTMPSVHVISWVTAYIIDKTRSSAHVIQTILCPDYFILCGLFHSVKTHVGEYDALDTEKMRTREACTAANNMTRGANMTPGANMTRGANMAWATNMARAGEGRRWGGRGLRKGVGCGGGDGGGGGGRGEVGEGMAGEAEGGRGWVRGGGGGEGMCEGRRWWWWGEGAGW